ncbi:MAG: cupin domain-containing protein [Ferruginibacter sp.]
MKYILTLVTLLVFNCAVAQLKPVGYGVFHFSESPVTKGELRETRKMAEGTTTEFEYFKVHVTTQQKGAVPRPAHAQKDIEELIIVTEGTLQCTIDKTTSVINAGSVLLIPPGTMQSVENKGNGPLTYYVFQFRSHKGMNTERSTAAGAAHVYSIDTLLYTEKDGKGTRKYFDRPTAACDRFEMHTTTLTKAGPSHAPHQHAETEIILVTDGVVEMMIDGKNFKGTAGDFFIAESGKLHGVSNGSDQRCTYYAFKWK